MDIVTCRMCGANEFRRADGYKICEYCGTKYEINRAVELRNKATFSVRDDILCLLEKCKNEPKNARKYANLILDIDPTNKEAKKYL